MILDRLSKQNAIHPPQWLPNNTVMMVIMGSQAYGVNNEDSDRDVYGICIPPKELVFPHLAGEIAGFGRQIQRFDVWSEHHIMDTSSNVEYDFAIYGIVKYFQLCMDNNPNMLDSLFVPRNCVIHSTQIAERIREQRKIFLHKGCWHKFKGYAYSSINKIGRRDSSGLTKFCSEKNIPETISFKEVNDEIKRREDIKGSPL